ncbi:hypothetical protein TK50_04960 [Micromonospora haikouensis]|uniref:Uncharacterized protein n=1 Tax=Micromonospora haikouensis TaxID=686309 RepID=A0A0D0X1V1_9ACTN|nr:hypothetical protein TK50_04960 [Micromonospora haikouensis]
MRRGQLDEAEPATSQRGGRRAALVRTCPTAGSTSISGHGHHVVLITSSAHLPEPNPHHQFDVCPVTRADSTAYLRCTARPARMAAEAQALAAP